MNNPTLAIPLGLDRLPAPPPAPAPPTPAPPTPAPPTPDAPTPDAPTPDAPSAATASATAAAKLLRKPVAKPAGSAVGQVPAPATSTAAPGFRKVSGGDSEMQSGFALMVEAYAVMWLLVFAFVWFSARRQRELQQRVERLSEDLEAMRDADAAEGDG